MPTILCDCEECTSNEDGICEQYKVYIDSGGMCESMRYRLGDDEDD